MKTLKLFSITCSGKNYRQYLFCHQDGSSKRPGRNEV